MVKAVGAVLAVFLDAHVGAFTDFVEVRSLVADERDSRENFNIAVDEFNAVGIAFESAFADADVFLIREELENFIAVVAVLGCGLSQVKFGVVVLVEEFLHAVCVIVMRVAQDASINCGKVDAHVGGVFGEECRSSCVELDVFAVEFCVDAKSPFAVQLFWRIFCRAGVASGTADVVDDDFDFHNAVVCGSYHSTTFRSRMTVMEEFLE